MPLPLNWYVIELPLADIGAVSGVRYVVTAPGFLRKVSNTLAAAITGVDSILTVTRNNVALAPTITVAFTGSAEGDYDFAEYYTGVAEGDWIEVNSDGGATNSVASTVALTLSS